jgi:hypothetical protein
MTRGFGRLSVECWRGIPVRESAPAGRGCIAKHQKDQHKLLELYYSGSIGADLFGQAERRLAGDRRAAGGVGGLRA